MRRNFSLVAPYWLKFIRCSLLFVKSLVTRWKIRSLLFAEVNYIKLKSVVSRTFSNAAIYNWVKTPQVFAVSQRNE